MASVRTPWLMIPPHSPQEDEEEDAETPSTFNFLNLKQSHIFNLKNMPPEISDSECVGSSFGWLMFLDKPATNPFLFHPFSQTQIRLPSFSLPSSRFSRKISKAIFSSEPAQNNTNWEVVVIYSEQSKLAYWRFGDSSWIELDGKNYPYYDIMYYNYSLFAISKNSLVEFWDFNRHIPRKMKKFKCPFPTKTSELGYPNLGLYTTNFYLVKSGNDVLFVVKFIGNLVNGEGKPVTEPDLLPDNDTHPLVFPYRTLFFHVYKLDVWDEKWVEVDCLDDCVLFLGANQSVSVSARDFPECRKNSIYFTDDFWDQMDLDYSYGGHDMGVYSLKDHSIKPFYKFDREKIVPPPFWVLPAFLVCNDALNFCI